MPVELLGLINKRWEHVTVRTSTFVICSVGAVHAIQAVLGMLFPLAVNSTPMIALTAFWRALGGGAPRQALLAAIMLAASAVATFGAIRSLGWSRLLLFLPQHFLLGIQAGGAILAIVVGHYLDGTAIASPHIATDQIFVCALFAIHFHAILRRSKSDH